MYVRTLSLSCFSNVLICSCAFIGTLSKNYTTFFNNNKTFTDIIWNKCATSYQYYCRLLLLCQTVTGHQIPQNTRYYNIIQIIKFFSAKGFVVFWSLILKKTQIIKTDKVFKDSIGNISLHLEHDFFPVIIKHNQWNKCYIFLSEVFWYTLCCW